MAETAYGTAMRKKRQKDKRKPNTGQRRIVNANAGVKCGAKKRGGGTCQMAAGYGTDHHGIGSCKHHGGNLPTHKLNAAKREAIFMGAPKEIDPVRALIWCIHITAGEVEWLSEHIAKLDEGNWYDFSSDVHGKQMNLLVRERAQAVERLAKFSKDALALGIAERAVRLAETYGASIARMLKGVLDELVLTDDQKAIAPQIVRKHLVLLEGTQAEPKALVSGQEAA